MTHGFLEPRSEGVSTGRTVRSGHLVCLYPFDNIGQTLIEHPPPSTPVSALATVSNVSVKGSNSRTSLLSSTLKYVFRTDVHTFAFSVAADGILSFFPFVLLLLTLIRRAFRSPANV
jgi:hypothetical protein